MAERRNLVLLGGAIGAVVAVLILAVFGGHRENTRDALVPAALIPEATGALDEVVLHYVPSMDAAIEAPYTDFLRAIAPDVRVVLVVAAAMSAEDEATLDRRLSSIDPSGALRNRVRRVESPGPITTWSKDRALVTYAPKPGASAWLIAPSEPNTSWVERHNDWLTVESIAKASSGRFLARSAPFDFDAGDVIVDGSTLIVDTNFLEKNKHRGIPDSAELRRRLSAWFRAPVLVIGERPGDTPQHHLAMYMTPLQPGLVLVGDPGLARDLVGEKYEPGESSVETAEPLQADFSTATQARFDFAARELARRGYRVERIPNVPFDAKTYFSYTNGVFETRGERKIAYMPIYGVDALDLAARKTYERLGWEVRPIRVRSVYQAHGTVGCLVNVLARNQGSG